MISMIEPDSHQSARSIGRLLHRYQFVCAPRSGLFNQDVFTFSGSSGCNRRQLIVRGRDKHGIDVGTAHHLLPIGTDRSSRRKSWPAPPLFPHLCRNIRSWQPGPINSGRASARSVRSR